MQELLNKSLVIAELKRTLLNSCRRAERERYDPRRCRTLFQLQVHRLRDRLSGGMLLRRGSDFYEGEAILYIHPDECIDCEACVPECPVEAIFHEDNLPEEWTDFTALNAEMCSSCPVITEQKESLASQGGDCPGAS